MKRKSFSAGLLTFVIVLILTTVVAVLYLSNASRVRRERAQFVADSLANRIEAEIRTRGYITRILEIEIASNNGIISSDSFSTIGSALFDDYLDIIDITLAPNGVVSYVYPEDSAISGKSDLFRDSSQGVYADYSKMSGVPVIIAPTTLSDGSYGIIIRRPVYTRAERTDSTFWGFASVTLNLSSFLSVIDIKGLADGGYEYKLTGNNPITGESRLIMEYSEKELPSPVESMISTVGGSYWTLSIAPMGNWMELYEIAAVFVVAIVISILGALAMAAYMSMKANAKELEILSYRDSLTNLYNPRSYQEHMDELSKKKLPYGLIYMDLNDFKMVNDTYGHDAGDVLLNIVAKRLKNSIREKDRAFRIGGDEFVVVIHGTHDKKFYDEVIARMRQNVARDVTIGEVTLKVSISAGYARCPEDGTRFEDVVKKADDAMYHNKRLLKARRLAGKEPGKVTARDFQ